MTDAKIPKWDGQKENGTGRKEKNRKVKKYQRKQN
jgi:hypothetical protein